MPESAGGKRSPWNASDWSTRQVELDRTKRRRTLRGTTKLMGSTMLPTHLNARAISFSDTLSARGGRKHIPRWGDGLEYSALATGQRGSRR